MFTAFDNNMTMLQYCNSDNELYLSYQSVGNTYNTYFQIYVVEFLKILGISPLDRTYYAPYVVHVFQKASVVIQKCWPFTPQI